MPRLTERPDTFVHAMWRASAPLTGAALLLLAMLAVSLAALWIDPREITGAPAWLKPAKFALSTALYAATLAWFFTYLPDWPRLRRFAGWATALSLVLEVVLIGAQAWRGTTSHFNVGTVFDAVVFTVMGVAILFQTFVAIAVAVALWRQPFSDRAIGWALRLGLAISIAGASTGGLMTRPTALQLADARAAGRLAVAGAHTVGAIDGGPGMPGTGWSRTHGDLRVPHFLGLHAMQALPLLALLLRRRLGSAASPRVIVAAAATYSLLFALLLWQALRGQSLLAPDVASLTGLAGWIVFAIAAVWIAAAPRPVRLPSQAAA